MKQKLAFPWAQNPFDQRREPTGAELAAGFACGPADRELFNELMYRLSGAEAEIIKVITEADLVPDEMDLTQLWQALQHHFMRRYEDEIDEAGEILLTDLEADTYYVIFASSTSFATWSTHGSTDNGVTWRTDYLSYDVAETPYTVASSHVFQVAGEMDLISIYTGTATIPGIFYRAPGRWFAFADDAMPRKFANAPVGHISGIRITTDTNFRVAVQKVS